MIMNKHVGTKPLDTLINNPKFVDVILKMHDSYLNGNLETDLDNFLILELPDLTHNQFHTITVNQDEWPHFEGYHKDDLYLAIEMAENDIELIVWCMYGATDEYAKGHTYETERIQKVDIDTTYINKRKR